MTKCILIFNELEKCLDLLRTFEKELIILEEALVIKPEERKTTETQKALINANGNNLFKFLFLDQIRSLNPKLDRKIRQNNMKRWLMPFGFVAGLGFSNMTNLSTFSFLGLNSIGQSLLGGILGMISGYIGSYFSAASINLNRDKELRSIINFNKQGKWLILLEDKFGYELPWNLIKESESIDIIFLNN